MLKIVKDMDPRIGCCIDVGHAARAGANLVESIHAAGPRLYDMHVKDLTSFSSKESQVPVGAGTFWFSWIPGKDFMEVWNQADLTFPTGWSVNITGSNNSSDGNALQFLGGPLLTPGNTDDFSFESTESLSQITGPSSCLPPIPTSAVTRSPPPR